MILTMIFGIKEDPYNVLLAIATNMAVLFMTGCVLQGHTWVIKRSAELPSFDHLVASLEPADAGHPPARRGSVQIDDHIVLRYQQLQTTDHIPADIHRANL